MKYANVLAIVAAGSVSAEVIAKKSKITVPAARGALRSLRNAGYVGGDNSEATITKAGERFLGAATVVGNVEPLTPTGRQHKRTTKAAKAATLFQRHIGKGRPAVLAAFQKQLDMTPGGASTYFQNIKKELGLTGQTASA